MTRKAERQKRLQLALRMMETSDLQFLSPATVREVLATEAEKPMRAGNKDLAHESLFGDAHKQIDLF